VSPPSRPARKRSPRKRSPIWSLALALALTRAFASRRLGCAGCVMEDALLGMAEAPQHVVCTGWRPAVISDWRDAIDAHAIFDLDRGGNVTAEHYFQAKVISSPHPPATEPVCCHLTLLPLPLIVRCCVHAGPTFCARPATEL
jgi:hypothetical protein